MISSRIKIGARGALIVGALVLLIYAFSVRSDTLGTTFATGSGPTGLEMKIDSRTIYNGVLQPKLSWALKNLKPWCDFFFQFFDVKPGDTGQNTISIHITKNPAWVCLDFVNLHDRERGENEPESLVDASLGGELSRELEFFSWMDDGDNVYEVGERPLFGTSTQSAYDVLRNKTYALADAKTGTAFPVGSTRYVGIYWCAGNLSVNTATAQLTCDAEAMGNEAQTDSMSIDVSLRAVVSTQQKHFLCVPEKKKECDKDKGNNGHGGVIGDGNDSDRNDDSNPGASNDEDDNTDDDGTPPGQTRGEGEDDDCDDVTGGGHNDPWRAEKPKTGALPFLIEVIKDARDKLRTLKRV